jgi:hypothetical protein
MALTYVHTNVVDQDPKKYVEHIEFAETCNEGSARTRYLHKYYVQVCTRSSALP